MTKFHINKHGAPAPCKAQKGKCPLGGDSGKENHFDNKEEAQNYADKINEAEYNLMPGVSDETNQEKKLTPAQTAAKEKKEQKERLTKRLGAFWLNNDGSSDEKMVKHCVNNIKYVEIGNSFIEVADSKPTIHKQMWYDDETDAPEANLENFRDYNIKMSLPKKYEMSGRNLNGRGSLKAIHQFGNKNGLELATLTYDNPEDIKGEYKEISESELEEINKGVDEVRDNYEKRIKTYFNKYGDKIRASGYWKNR